MNVGFTESPSPLAMQPVLSRAMRMLLGREHFNEAELATFDLAERRYEAVDPANRLIAATLEQRWNEAMQHLHDSKPSWRPSSGRPCGP
jgi:hypothetical protein